MREALRRVYGPLGSWRRYLFEIVPWFILSTASVSFCMLVLHLGTVLSTIITIAVIAEYTVIRLVQIWLRRGRR